MKRVLLYISTILIFGCSNDPEINSLADIQNELKSKSQNFQIELTKDTLLKCSEGTVVYIPANSFVFKNGHIPKGKIQINIVEVQSIASMIGNSISTISNGSIIETNGMLQVSATIGTDTLIIDKSRSIVVMFPKNEKRDFSLFYGAKDSSDQINWVFDDKDNITPDSTLSNVNISNDTSLIKKYITKCGGTVGESLKNEYDHVFTWKVNDIDSAFDTHLEKALNKNQNLYAYFTKYNIYLRAEIYLDSKGKIKKVDLDDTTKFKTELRNVLYQLPPFDLKSMKREDMNESFTLIIGVYTKVDKEKYLERFNSKYKKYLNQAIEKVDKAEMNYFIYSVTNLGWINCDRFPMIEKKQDEFTISPNRNVDTKVFVVFKGMRSIIEAKKKGNSYTVANVPSGQDVKIVAISYNNSKPYVSIENISTAKRKIELLNYKEFTLDELKHALN